MVITILLAFILVLVLLLLVIITTAFWGFVITRVPYVRSNLNDTVRLLKKIPLSTGSIFYDLGSGDGRVVFMAEKMYKVRGVGFELTFWTHVVASIKKRLKNSNAEFLRKNFFKVEWTNAQVIYCFLYPPLMGKVETKFLEECLPGTLLISRDFALPNLKPSEIMDFTHPHNAYIYRR